MKFVRYTTVLSCRRKKKRKNRSASVATPVMLKKSRPGEVIAVEQLARFQDNGRSFVLCLKVVDTVRIRASVCRKTTGKSTRRPGLS